MKIIIPVLLVSIFLLILFAVLIAVYVCRTKKGETVSRMNLYVAVAAAAISGIGIIVSVLLVLSPPVPNPPTDTNETTLLQPVESNITPNIESSTVDATTDTSETNDGFAPTQSSTKEPMNAAVPTESTYNKEQHITSEINTENETSESHSSFMASSFSEIATYYHDGSCIVETVTSDPRGNTYNDAYVFYGEYYTWNTGDRGYGKPYIIKNIDNRYDEFTATIIPHETFDKYNKGIEAEIRIYADDVLVYTSDTISRKTNCIEVSIPITGKDYIKIELIPRTDLENYFNQYSIILNDASLIAY